MKRVLSLILILVLIIGMMTFARAESIYFVAINDTIPNKLSSASMPFYYSGVLYIPYTTFEDDQLKISTSYPLNGNTLTLYNKPANKAQSLTFDMNTGKVKDADGNEYDYAARSVGGVVFVPVEFVCSYFGFGCSFLTANQGYPMVRITTGGEWYDDEGFVIQSKNLVSDRAAEYLASADQQPSPSPSAASSPSPSPSADPEPTDEPVEEIPDETEPPEEPTPSIPDVPRDLTISMIGISETAAVLFDTYDIKAAFFLTVEDMDSDNLIRRLFCKGHSLGAAVDMSSIDNALEDLELINSVLCDIIKTKTLIVCPADPDNVSADAAEALYDLGCVVWQYGIDGDTDYETVENFDSGINVFLSGHLSGDESGERAMKLTNLLAKIGSSDDIVHSITAATVPPDESFTVLSNEIDVEEDNGV